MSSGKKSLIGENFYTFLTDDKKKIKIQDLSKNARKVDSRTAVDLHFLPSLVRINEHRAYDCILYAVDELTVIEIENHRKGDSASHHAGVALTSLLPDLREYESIASLCNYMVNSIRNITGYDRVMMYRFDNDFNGCVIAEDKNQELDPFLGLNYPASDIPAQARELYKKNLIRMIGDIDATPVALLPSLESSKRSPLNLSHSMLRSVSPFHIEYLRNMGVQATMSISIVINGELWGFNRLPPLFGEDSFSKLAPRL